MSAERRKKYRTFDQVTADGLHRLPYNAQADTLTLQSFERFWDSTREFLQKNASNLSRSAFLIVHNSETCNISEELSGESILVHINCGTDFPSYNTRIRLRKLLCESKKHPKIGSRVFFRYWGDTDEGPFDDVTISKSIEGDRES